MKTWLKDTRARVLITWAFRASKWHGFMSKLCAATGFQEASRTHCFLELKTVNIAAHKLMEKYRLRKVEADTLGP